PHRKDRVHSRGAVNWCQPMAGSGGSQGFSAMASRMASRAVVPWAAAEARELRIRHPRARVASECQEPDTAWWRLAGLAPGSETLFVQSTAKSRVNRKTCSL